VSRYRCVDAQKAAGFPVVAACQAAGVSASAFYAWSASNRQEPSPADHKEAELVAEIRTIHRQSSGTYGSPRVHAELRRRGQRVNHKRVERLMATHGIVGHRPRRRRSLTKPDTGAPPAPDLLGRLFDPDRPDVAWCGDVTYIPTDEGWLYLASVLDLASRHLLGWSMGTHHDARLVTGALDAAVATRGRHRMDATIFHSDRGREYTSAANTPRPPVSTPASGSGFAAPWAAPDHAWTTQSPRAGSPPSRWSWSTAATTAPAPRHEPRSSAGSPGTTSVGCTPPTTTYRRLSGNSGTVMAARCRQPWPHSHGVRPAGESPLRTEPLVGRLGSRHAAYGQGFAGDGRAT
jgi:putative transposase